MKTTYVISTTNENQFETSLSAAATNFNNAISALKEMKQNDTVRLFSIPVNENSEISENDYLISCLENNTAIEIKAENV